MLQLLSSVITSQPTSEYQLLLFIKHKLTKCIKHLGTVQLFHLFKALLFYSILKCLKNG